MNRRPPSQCRSSHWSSHEALQSRVYMIQIPVRLSQGWGKEVVRFRHQDHCHEALTQIDKTSVMVEGIRHILCWLILSLDWWKYIRSKRTILQNLKNNNNNKELLISAHLLLLLDLKVKARSQPWFDFMTLWTVASSQASGPWDRQEHHGLPLLFLSWWLIQPVSASISGRPCLIL